MTAAIVDTLRIIIMVAAAAGAVIAGISAVLVVLAFSWYARSSWRGE